MSAVGMFSQRGKELLVHDGFKFRKVNVTSEGQKWRCTNKKCPAKLFVDLSGDILPMDSHNHEVCSTLARQYVSNSLKQKACSEPLSDRPQKMIRTEIINAPKDVQNVLTKKDVEYIKRNAYNEKRKKYPPLPVDINDVHDALDSISIQSSQQEAMLQLNNRDSHIVIFTTVHNLRYLCKARTIFVDGTFSYCPKYFTQMFTLHMAENENYVPLVWSLLPNKQSETYSEFFKHLITVCEQAGENLLPSVIVADFEQAIHGAVKSVWPTTILQGCRFHLSQAWWRKIQNLGLSKYYMDQDSECGRWLRWTFGLPLLDPTEATDCFVTDFMSVMPLEAELFSDYLVDTYISEEADFPPHLWASTNATSERTTRE